MAIQTEEKKVKVKKVKANKSSSAENQPSQVCDSSAAEKSTDAPLIKLEESQMKEALIAFKKLVDLRDSEKKQDLLGSASGEGRKVQISIAAIKLPRVSEAQVLKLPLPHSITPASRDVCLIVKDFEKGIKPDHEPTVAHYEALLAEKGVKGVTKVMSLRELKVEYKTFESKTALSHLYDHFLVDARIIRLVPKFLGKPFYKRKKFPVQVKLDSKDLSKEVERALKVSCLALTQTGTSSCVTIGLTSMPEGQLCSNLVAAVRLLETKYPGGWANIRALHLLSGTDSLPFYVTLRATKEVGLVRGLKRKNKGLVTDELSTVVGATVTVTPTGGVKVKRVKDPLWPEDGDVAMEVTNEVAELEAEAVEEEEKKSEKKEGKKVKKPKKQAAEEDSDDEMEDKEMAYMQKIADEEEEMEKKLEASEDKLEEKLSGAEKSNENEESDNSDDEEEDVDDDAEAENLLSEGDDSESEDELIMKKSDFPEDEEEEDESPAPKKSKKSIKKLKAKASQPNPPKPKEKTGKKAQKQKKFVEQKKKAKLSKGKQ